MAVLLPTAIAYPEDRDARHRCYIWSLAVCGKVSAAYPSAKGMASDPVMVQAIFHDVIREDIQRLAYMEGIDQASRLNPSAFPGPLVPSLTMSSTPN